MKPHKLEALSWLHTFWKSDYISVKFEEKQQLFAVLKAKRVLKII